MVCPVCTDVQLALSERSGIEIDYCPRCRGVWLDRGELDTIIGRAGSREPGPDRWHDDHDEDGPSPRRRRRSESFLGELVDFGA